MRERERNAFHILPIIKCQNYIPFYRRVVVSNKRGALLYRLWTREINNGSEGDHHFRKKSCSLKGVL